MELNFVPNSTIYVIDTSGLIKLESTFIPNTPVFSAVWEEIEDMITEKVFVTIDFVEDEINSYAGKQNYLQIWVKKFKKHFVVPTDAETMKEAKVIVNQEYNTGFLDKKKQAEGKEEADPYLIAYCKAHKCTLITNESKEKPNKIPKVAEKYGVNCINIYEFMEQRGLKMQRKR